jgi:thioredoxin-related protein
MAWVTAWSDSTGKIDYYEFAGDFRTCPHPPLVLYDSKGREVLTIPNQPIDPNNKEMVENFEKLRQKRKKLLDGHTHSKPLLCSENPK